jgi:hypothetical protein
MKAKRSGNCLPTSVRFSFRKANLADFETSEYDLYFTDGVYMEGMSGNKVLVSFSLIALFSTSYARGDYGFARLDDESYYLKSQTRPDNTLALVLGPDLQGSGDLFTAKFELEGYLYVNDPSSFTIESQNAYVATNSSSLHQITLGRRIYDWSVADDVWKMGTWTPRFNWDPLNPEQIGNTGLFYTYQSKLWRILAFGSYVSVPERGVPLNSNLTSPSGDWVSPFNQVNLPALNNADIPIQYSLDYPATSQLIFYPSGALQVKFGENEGFWAQAGYAYMPIHQADLLIEGTLPAQAQQLDVTIHPMILMQHLITAETGLKQERWSLWASATREIPILNLVEPATWIQQPMGPASIFSGGVSWEALNNFVVSSSYLSVDEDIPSSAVPGNLSLNLPSRFPYSKAFQFGLDWHLDDRFNYRTLWIDDIANSSTILSLDLGYTPEKKSDWFFGVGTDLITSSTGQGLIGQFEGNDRLRLRLAYAL